MNYLFTNSTSARSSSRGMKKRGKSAPGTMKMKAAGTQFSETDMNWALESHQSEPLTVQTWTQTNTEPVNVQTGTQTPETLHMNDHRARSSYGPSGASSQAGLVSTPCDNFIMKKRSLLMSTPSQPSGGSSFLLPPNTENGDADSSINPVSQLSSDLTRGRTDDKGSKPDPVTDYTLLGVCNQIQTLLHKDLLQPVIGYNGRPTG
ncbi:hypothetical protein BaRGS_00028136, partial [Batillaria attramentaria]